MAEIKQPSSRNCSVCGAALISEARFCRKCGSPVAISNVTPAVDVSEVGGRTCLHNLIGALVFLFYAIAVFLSGAVYAWACEWIPFVIMPLLFFVAFSGFAAARVYRRFEMNKFLFSSVGIAIGCVAVYGNWFWFECFLNDIVEWNPLNLARCIHEISETRKISLHGVLPLTSGALSLCYFLETVIIVGMTLAVSFQFDDRCCKKSGLSDLPLDKT
jgi:hypothetical protein